MDVRGVYMHVHVHVCVVYLLNVLTQLGIEVHDFSTSYMYLYAPLTIIITESNMCSSIYGQSTALG